MVARWDFPSATTLLRIYRIVLLITWWCKYPNIATLWEQKKQKTKKNRRTAVQCSAVQCSAVQCSAVQCSAVQCSAVQCSAVQCSAVQCSELNWTLLYSLLIVFGWLVDWLIDCWLVGWLAGWLCVLVWPERNEWLYSVVQCIARNSALFLTDSFWLIVGCLVGYVF
jgi:hypothetical protein